MNICYEIGSRLYKKRILKRSESESSRSDNPLKYWEWQFDTSGKYLGKFFDLYEQMPGKRVLDIGCGIGGRTCFLTTKGPKNIIGIDINHAEIDTAEQLAIKRLPYEQSKLVQFIKVKENETLQPSSFDIILLIDCLEHVKNPVSMLNYAYDLTRPGGICYFGTVGWYNHAASHLTTILPIPFLTVFFSDRQILDAVRKIISSSYYKPNMWDSHPPVKRWENINNLRDRPGEYLNKITIFGLKKAIRQSKFKKGRLHLESFSWKQAPFMKCFNLLTYIPGIQEIYHSGCFGRLERN